MYTEKNSNTSSRVMDQKYLGGCPPATHSEQATIDFNANINPQWPPSLGTTGYGQYKNLLGAQADGDPSAYSDQMALKEASYNQNVLQYHK